MRVLEVRLAGQEKASLVGGGALGDDVVVAVVSHEAFGGSVVLVGDLNLFFRALLICFGVGRLDTLALNSLMEHMPEQPGGLIFTYVRTLTIQLFLDAFLEMLFSLSTSWVEEM